MRTKSNPIGVKEGEKTLVEPNVEYDTDLVARKIIPYVKSSNGESFSARHVKRARAAKLNFLCSDTLGRLNQGCNPPNNVKSFKDYSCDKII